MTKVGMWSREAGTGILICMATLNASETALALHVSSTQRNTRLGNFGANSRFHLTHIR